LSQVYQDSPKSIKDVLVPLEGVLLLEVLPHDTNLNVEVSLTLWPSELIRIAAPNFPFQDELNEKAFRIIVSSFQALADNAHKS